MIGGNVAHAVDVCVDHIQQRHRQPRLHDVKRRLDDQFARNLFGFQFGHGYPYRPKSLAKKIRKRRSLLAAPLDRSRQGACPSQLEIVLAPKRCKGLAHGYRCAARISSQIRGGVRGSSFNCTPSELSAAETAFVRTPPTGMMPPSPAPDRKSTRLNSSHANISYAVFCLEKKKQPTRPACRQ